MTNQLIKTSADLAKWRDESERIRAHYKPMRKHSMYADQMYRMANGVVKACNMQLMVEGRGKTTENDTG